VPYRDLPQLIERLLERRAQTPRAIAAITLSCLRTQEFVQMRRCELDLDAEQPKWTIPYRRFKVDPHKQDYVVPLAPQFVAILREQIAELEEILGGDNVDYIWPSSLSGTRGKPPKHPYISDGTMRGYLQKAMEVDATIHGMRASFNTWASGQFLEGTTSTPKYHEYAVEFCLAHVKPGGNTKAAYQRGMMYEARIGIMRDWADHCLPPKPAVTKDKNVVAIADHRAA
jgi:integrase